MAFTMISRSSIVISIALTPYHATRAFYLANLHNFATTTNTATTPTRAAQRTQLHMSAAPPPTNTLPIGVEKTVKVNGRGAPVRVGDVATVRYSCYVLGPDGVSVVPPAFAKSPAAGQSFVVGDGTMIDGWDLALQTMEVGERCIVRLTDSNFAYGAQGVPPFVPENAVVQMDLEVLDLEAGVDLGTIASADPLKPRTPASIAAAYNTRREQMAIEEANKKPGLEGLVAKFKTFYFFGFFEGETGQQAPWYLRPSITFPIAFAVVGLAFAAAFLGGGITSRGEQVKDELDEFITTTTSTSINQMSNSAGEAAVPTEEVQTAATVLFMVVSLLIDSGSNTL